MPDKEKDFYEKFKNWLDQKTIWQILWKKIQGMHTVLHINKHK